MNIIAIDPSKKCTGVFLKIDGKEESLSITHGIKVVQRDVLLNIYYMFTKLLKENEFGMGFIEGYWLVHPRGMTIEPEIVGVIRLVFALAGIPLITVPIATWKSIVKIGVDKKKKPAEYLRVINHRYMKQFELVDEADAYLIYIATRYIARHTKTMSKAATKVRNQIKEVMEGNKCQQ